MHNFLPLDLGNLKNQVSLSLYKNKFGILKLLGIFNIEIPRLFQISIIKIPVFNTKR